MFRAVVTCLQPRFGLLYGFLTLRAAAQIGHAQDLSLGAALRDGPVVVRDEPVSTTPYIVKALAGAAFHNDCAAVLLHGFMGDQKAKLCGRPSKGRETCACWGVDLSVIV